MLESRVLGWKLPTIKGGEANFINEAGLYRLIFRSNKPKANEFATWVCEVVLPAIRKHGHFGTVLRQRPPEHHETN
jgi:prophage antirepressor-like protein